MKDWDFSNLVAEQQKQLARHYVQRTRRDVQQYWKALGCFPQRETVEHTYTLSDSYLELFNRTYELCYELLVREQHLPENKRRPHYWGAMALLRCVCPVPRPLL